MPNALCNLRKPFWVSVCRYYRLNRPRRELYKCYERARMLDVADVVLLYRSFGCNFGRDCPVSHWFPNPSGVKSEEIRGARVTFTPDCFRKSDLGRCRRSVVEMIISTSTYDVTATPSLATARSCLPPLVISMRAERASLSIDGVGSVEIYLDQQKIPTYIGNIITQPNLASAVITCRANQVSFSSGPIRIPLILLCRDTQS
jgi:hypothetical protein